MLLTIYSDVKFNTKKGKQHEVIPHWWCEIKEMNQSLVVSEDFMFVRGLAFLVSVLRGIKFITIEYIPKRTAPVISKSLKKFYYIYHVHVFTVELFLMDREFE